MEGEITEGEAVFVREGEDEQGGGVAVDTAGATAAAASAATTPAGQQLNLDLETLCHVWIWRAFQSGVKPCQTMSSYTSLCAEERSTSLI